MPAHLFESLGKELIALANVSPTFLGKKNLSVCRPRLTYFSSLTHSSISAFILYTAAAELENLVLFPPLLNTTVPVLCLDL